MGSTPGEVTRLLSEARRGDRAAENQLLSVVYDELRRLAGSYLRRERPGHTLQPTALVHEAYIRLAGQNTPIENRGHFWGIAAQLMRQILVDHARKHRANKRGGGQVKATLAEGLLSAHDSRELVEIDEALTRLAAVDPRQCRVVELRYFAGLTVEETADALGCAPRTVKRDWRMAQAWLRRELGAADANEP